jgi:hypothetical protein
VAIFLLLAIALPIWGQTTTASTVSTEQFSNHVTQFLGREISAHVADIRSLDPPQDRVVGALSTGDFSWGAFMRALASYSALSGQRTIAGRDVPTLIGQIGLIEAKRGGKTFAQLFGAMALLHFGADLKTNPVWQALSPEEQAAWRSLLDPSRFYDRRTRHVINLPENYFGVASRLVAMDYQMGIITDRAVVDDVIDRAAEQFTQGNLYSDDGLPTGRYDRYSNEYARYVYEAAELAGRQDLIKAMEPTLKTQMRTWWDLLSPDGYGYSWGRTLGVVSYTDTIEIVAFLARHPEFRPAPLPQLATAYYVAWQWLAHDFQNDRHLLNVFAFGRGNYSYMTKDREWQQTGTFLGKVAGAHGYLIRALQQERVASFPAQLKLPEVARFEYFRKGERPAGVWLVRRGGLRFALPIVTGVRPGMSDYLPAPYSLPGFAPPVAQEFPTTTPFLQLAEGKVVFAGDGADEIVASPDGLSVRARWNRWAVVGTNPGATVDPGLSAEVTWKIEGNSLVRSETVTTLRPVSVRRFWVAIPSTASVTTTRIENGRRVDRFDSTEGALEVTVLQTDWPLSVKLQATGDSALGKGSRGPVPLYLDLQARDVMIEPAKPMKWTLVLTAMHARSVE